MTTAQPLRFETPDDGEETARADLYGLLAGLFYSPPSRELLDAIAAAPSEGGGVLRDAWHELASTCGKADANALREEYEALFIGVGKPELMLYGSWYLSGFLMEKPLAALRNDLARLGLERPADVPESEDHIAMLFEVMRYLIAGDDPMIANIAVQKEFFSMHIQPWAVRMCEAVEAHPGAGFYRLVATLAKRFLEVEMQAFDMA